MTRRRGLRAAAAVVLLMSALAACDDGGVGLRFEVFHQDDPDAPILVVVAGEIEAIELVTGPGIAFGAMVRLKDPLPLREARRTVGPGESVDNRSRIVVDGQSFSGWLVPTGSSMGAPDMWVELAPIVVDEQGGGVISPDAFYFCSVWETVDGVPLEQAVFKAWADSAGT